MPSCENMQCHWTASPTALATSEAVLTYKARQSGSPSYLAFLISDYVLSRSLRSLDKLLLSRPYTSLSWRRTRHFLLVLQRSEMTCLLTVVLQLVSIVLNAILNANSFTLHTLITPSNSRLSRLQFQFSAWTDRRVTNWFCICIWTRIEISSINSAASNFQCIFVHIACI